MADLTQDQLRELAVYRDGGLYSFVERGTGRTKIWIGDQLGFQHGSGYWIFVYHKVRNYLHRAIWIYHNGAIPASLEIDHLNRNKGDNRIENLRVVSHGVNMKNVDSSRFATWTGVRKEGQYKTETKNLTRVWTNKGIQAMTKGIKRLLKKVSANVQKEIETNASFAGGGKYARGMASEGYAGGYAQAIADVQLALNGTRPTTRGYWNHD